MLAMLTILNVPLEPERPLDSSKKERLADRGLGVRPRRERHERRARRVALDRREKGDLELLARRLEVPDHVFGRPLRPLPPPPGAAPELLHEVAADMDE